MGESKPRINCSKDKFVKTWLNTSHSFRRTSIDGENRFGELYLAAVNDIPRQPLDMPLQPLDGGEVGITFTSLSKKSSRSSVGPYDTDFRQSLGYHNIYIGCKEPPIELMRRAKEIIP